MINFVVKIVGRICVFLVVLWILFWPPSCIFWRLFIVLILG